MNDLRDQAGASRRQQETTTIVRRAQRRVRWRERLIAAAARVLPAPNDHHSPRAWSKGGIILLYHRIVADGFCDDPFAVREADFRAQLAHLKDHYIIVPASEQARRLRAGHNLSGLLSITFDDGYDCTYSRAWPTLRVLGLPATLFVDTDRLDGPLPALTRGRLAELAGGGFEIGSHGCLHRDSRTLDDDTLRRELHQSRETLREITGQPVAGFAYPFGSYDDRVLELVRQAGYEYACTCRQHRTNHAADDPYRLTRVEINLDDDLPRVRAKLAGRYAGVYAAWYRLNPMRRLWLQEA